MRAAEDFLSPKMLLCTTIRIPRCVNANVCLIDTRGGLFWVHLILYYLVPSHVITTVFFLHIHRQHLVRIYRIEILECQ